MRSRPPGTVPGLQRTVGGTVGSRFLPGDEGSMDGPNCSFREPNAIKLRNCRYILDTANSFSTSLSPSLISYSLLFFFFRISFSEGLFPLNASGRSAAAWRTCKELVHLQSCRLDKAPSRAFRGSHMMSGHGSACPTNRGLAAFKYKGGIGSPHWHTDEAPRRANVESFSFGT